MLSSGRQADQLNVLPEEERVKTSTKAFHEVVISKRLEQANRRMVDATLKIASFQRPYCSTKILGKVPSSLPCRPKFRALAMVSLVTQPGVSTTYGSATAIFSPIRWDWIKSVSCVLFSTVVLRSRYFIGISFFFLICFSRFNSKKDVTSTGIRLG